MRRAMTLLAMSLALLTTALIAQAAPGDAGLNARMIRWQSSDAIVHIIWPPDDPAFPTPDQGRFGTTAVVPEGKPLLFGFEFVGPDEADLEEYAEDLTMTMTIDGGSPIDVTSGFLSVFHSDGTGPRWTWDHDADGPGDGDGDGIGDGWVGSYVLPYRYAHQSGLTAGSHTVEFILYDSGAVVISDTIDFLVTP